MRLANLLSIGLLLFTASCSSPQNTITYSVPDVEIPDEDLSTKIVVLNFEIVKSKNNKTEISLANTELIPGRLEESELIYPPRELGKLVVHLLDENNKIIEELVIKKPYLQIIEENDSGGKIELQNDDVKELPLSVRYNENSNIKSIQIFKIEDERTVEIFHEKIVD
ncbi:hypothetical protein ERX46_09635 [Brumimicrobium glaciale]|uniref:Lipoprotein n=1 Tax=Brumimicrobium glaciale TaxID=200475 RepID=A0A4Q4KM69_9FLAO|nr:hypothetical protein [Brumimicrobium glaciale]RYM34208.1 hypothetical protein ERX46_09635 [Brumimicrobium glaciale]